MAIARTAAKKRCFDCIHCRVVPARVVAEGLVFRPRRSGDQLARCRQGHWIDSVGNERAVTFKSLNRTRGIREVTAFLAEECADYQPWDDLKEEGHES